MWQPINSQFMKKKKIPAQQQSHRLLLHHPEASKTPPGIRKRVEKHSAQIQGTRIHSDKNQASPTRQSPRCRCRCRCRGASKAADLEPGPAQISSSELKISSSELRRKESRIEEPAMPELEARRWSSRWRGWGWLPVGEEQAEAEAPDAEQEGPPPGDASIPSSASSPAHGCR